MEWRCVNVVSKSKCFSSSIIRQTAKQPSLESVCVLNNNKTMDNLKQNEIRRNFAKIIMVCSSFN